MEVPRTYKMDFCDKTTYEIIKFILFNSTYFLTLSTIEVR